MVVESFAIIAIILAMAYIFLRAGKKVYSYGILPLLLVPVMQLGLDYIAKFVMQFLPFEMVSIKICLIFITLIVACILTGFIGSKLQKKSARTVYLIICGMFTLVLSMIFILRILKG